MKNKWNILVVDDQPIITFSISRHLNTFAWCNCVYESANGEDAIAIIKQNNIDLVILDHSMPIMNGYETTLYLKKHYPHIKIIIYSSYNDANLITGFIEAGVHAYLTKEFLEIEKAISRVMAGHLYIMSSSLSLSDYPKNNNGNERPILFSTKEFELLKLIANGKDNIEISKELKLSCNSVVTYKKRLIKKYRVNTITELVHYAHKIGVL